MPRGVILFLVLLAFWAGNSMHFEPHLVAIGVVTAAATAWLARRHELLLADWRARDFARALVVYLPWLVKEILWANLRVIRLVWSPRLEIDPRMTDVRCWLRTETGRALFADSITLTPGTVTVTVGPDRFQVHALTRGDVIEGDEEQGMQRRVAALEPAT